jgi:hypothetical protein
LAPGWARKAKIWHPSDETAILAWRLAVVSPVILAPPATFWIAAEGKPQFQALWPGARLDPVIAAPEAYAGRDWSRDDAPIEILRALLVPSGRRKPAAAACHRRRMVTFGMVD